MACRWRVGLNPKADRRGGSDPRTTVPTPRLLKRHRTFVYTGEGQHPRGKATEARPAGFAHHRLPQAFEMWELSKHFLLVLDVASHQERRQCSRDTLGCRVAM